MNPYPNPIPGREPGPEPEPEPRPGQVRAASEEERLRLCALWRGEHSYQGWSIMLGCEGRRPAETEPLCTNVGALVRLRCGFVDFAQAETVKMGGVYGEDFWLRDDQSRAPPHVCGSRRTLRMVTPTLQP